MVAISVYNPLSDIKNLATITHWYAALDIQLADMLWKVCDGISPSHTFRSEAGFHIFLINAVDY